MVLEVDKVAVAGVLSLIALTVTAFAKGSNHKDVAAAIANICNAC